MVKLGDNEVIFSTSFVMDKNTVNSAFVEIPNYPTLNFKINLVAAPSEATELPYYRWCSFTREDGTEVLRFTAMPEGKTEFYNMGVGMADKGFKIQIIRQAIYNDSMLVHVIVVQEPR